MIFIIIPILIILLILVIKKDIFHPLIITTVSWLPFVGLASLRLSTLITIWPIKTWIVFIGAAISLIVGALIPIIYSRKENHSQLRISIQLNRGKSLLIFYICIFAFLVSSVINRGVPLFSTNKTEAYTDFFSIFGLKYLIAYIPIVISILYYQYIFTTKRKTRIFLFIHILIGFSLLIMTMGRIFPMQAIISCIIIRHYFVKKLGIIKILVLAVISLLIFSMLGQIRIVQFGADFLSKQGGTNFPERFKLLQMPYIYFSTSLQNASDIIEYDNIKHTYGTQTFQSLFALTFTKRLFNFSIDIPALRHHSWTTYTFLKDIYMDFGIVGAIFFPFFYGFIISILYSKRYNRNFIYILLYSVFIFMTIFISFSNLYNYPTYAFQILFTFIVFSKYKILYNPLKPSR